MKKLIIIFLMIFFFNEAFAKCDEDKRQAIDKPEDLKIVDPSSLKLSFYDEKFDEANAIGYQAYSKNGGNFGIGAIEMEAIDFYIIKDEKIELCAGVSYLRVFETTSIGFVGSNMNSLIRSQNFELCEPTEFEKQLPNWDHICNWYEGDGKFNNLSKKNKGMKGNKSNSVVYSTGDFNHKNGSELSCVAMVTGFEDNYPGYYKTMMIATLCTSDFNYLTTEKIKSLGTSLGVYGVVDPPIGQRLSFHK